MDEAAKAALDEKVLNAIRNKHKYDYYGLPLEKLEKRFVRVTKGPVDSDIWASLSRLVQRGLIKKTGSHRYKGYTAV